MAMDTELAYQQVRLLILLALVLGDFVCLISDKGLLTSQVEKEFCRWHMHIPFFFRKLKDASGQSFICIYKTLWGKMHNVVHGGGKIYITLQPMGGGLYNPQPMKMWTT
jgi:hypothetical protein